jgi:hypothetical protein
MFFISGQRQSCGCDIYRRIYKPGASQPLHCDSNCAARPRVLTSLYLNFLFSRANFEGIERQISDTPTAWVAVVCLEKSLW